MVRIDNRGLKDPRKVNITPGYQVFAEGSALIDMGQTRVICAASVVESVPHFLKGTGTGWVTAEYNMLPRSTINRTPRETSTGRPKGRTLEIQRLIGRSLRAVTDLKALGERSVKIDGCMDQDYSHGSPCGAPSTKPDFPSTLSSAGFHAIPSVRPAYVLAL